MYLCQRKKLASKKRKKVPTYFFGKKGVNFLKGRKMAAAGGDLHMIVINVTPLAQMRRFSTVKLTIAAKPPNMLRLGHKSLMMWRRSIRVGSDM